MVEVLQHSAEGSPRHKILVTGRQSDLLFLLLCFCLFTASLLSPLLLLAVTVLIFCYGGETVGKERWER